MIQMRIVAGEGKLDLDTVGEALKENLESFGGGLQFETVTASGKHRSLKFDGSIGLETHRITKVAHGAARSGS